MGLTVFVGQNPTQNVMFVADCSAGAQDAVPVIKVGPVHPQTRCPVLGLEHVCDRGGVNGGPSGRSWSGAMDTEPSAATQCRHT